MSDMKMTIPKLTGLRQVAEAHIADPKTAAERYLGECMIDLLDRCESLEKVEDERDAAPPDGFAACTVEPPSEVERLRAEVKRLRTNAKAREGVMRREGDLLRKAQAMMIERYKRALASRRADLCWDCGGALPQDEP